MSSDSRENVTRLLLELNEDALADASRQRLWDAVHDELRAIAQRLMASENRGHTLQPTALVHEAYLRLVDQDKADWQNRAHFYAIAARMMRRILVDHARRKASLKRGGEWERVTLSEPIHEDMTPVLETIALERALEKLATLSERMVRVVELRIFGGLTMKEVAHVLNVSKRTVDKDWVTASQWLTRELSTGAA